MLKFWGCNQEREKIVDAFATVGNIICESVTMSYHYLTHFSQSFLSFASKYQNLLFFFRCVFHFGIKCSHFSATLEWNVSGCSRGRTGFLTKSPPTHTNCDACKKGFRVSLWSLVVSELPVELLKLQHADKGCPLALPLCCSSRRQRAYF